MQRASEREHNILLEACQHRESTFATLTLAEQHITRLDTGLATLVKNDATLFVKRFRAHLAKAIPGATTRIAYAGEYGRHGHRPHFHVLIFGLPPWLARPLIEKAWTLGHVDAIDFTAEKATYMAKDIIKGLTRGDDFRLQGRAPEFFQGPLRPGLGMGAIKRAAETMLEIQRKTGRHFLDVPSLLKHGKRARPINTYRRRRMREFMGRAPNTPHGAQFIDDDTRAAIEAAERDAASQPGGKAQFQQFLRDRLAARTGPAINTMRARLLLRGRYFHDGSTTRRKPKP